MITASQCQATLNGSLTCQPCVAPFSVQGLVNHLVELIVTEDEAFYLLDKLVFRRLLHYLHPELTSKDIPHCTKICQEVLACSVQAESNVKETLQVHPAFACQVMC